MSWASRRRAIIVIILSAIGIAVLAAFYMTFFYKAPSCSDGVENQGETGVDCGGPCQYLCVSQERAPTVLFTKAISNGKGRTDVIASVENSNVTAAAKDIPYTVTLYDARQVFVQQVTGTLDLPPSATVPVYIHGISSGSQEAIRAFLVIASSTPRWFTMTNNSIIKPVVTSTALGGSADSPRIDAVLKNASIVQLSNVPVVVFVRNEQGEVIAASRTVIPIVPPQGEATATFTWNTAFPSAPAAIEVMPVISLP